MSFVMKSMEPRKFKYFAPDHVAGSTRHPIISANDDFNLKVNRRITMNHLHPLFNLSKPEGSHRCVVLQSQMASVMKKGLLNQAENSEKNDIIQVTGGGPSWVQGTPQKQRHCLKRRVAFSYVGRSESEFAKFSSQQSSTCTKKGCLSLISK